jgi:hypothetical protein
VWLRSDIGSKTGVSSSSSERAPEEIPVFTCTCTKPLGAKSIAGVATAECRSVFWVTDCVTKYLWDAWVGQEWSLETSGGSNAGSDLFFFPCQGEKDFDWDLPISRKQHDAAVQQCATDVGVDMPAEYVMKMTSKSVRYGSSAETARDARAVILKANRRKGRSANSKMELGVYAPPDVLMEPGPVLGDAEGIAERFASFKHDYFSTIKTQLLCSFCGYPSCPCAKCISKGRSHICWLKGKAGKPPRSGHVEREGQEGDMLSAWAAHGIESVPSYKAGKYSWC